MKRKSNFKFLMELSGTEKNKLYISALFSILSSILAIVPYVLMYNIILELFKDAMDLNRVKHLVITTIITLIIRFALFLTSGTLSHIAAFTILYEVRMKSIEHISKLNMGFFTSHTTGELKKTINEDIEKLENFIAHQIPDLSAAAVTPLVVFSYLLFLNWKLALILLIPVLLGLSLQWIMISGFNKRMTEYHEVLKTLNSTIIQYINGMPVIKAFNLSTKSFEQYKNATEEYEKYWQKVAKQMGAPYGIFTVVIDSGLIFMIPAGGVLYLNGNMNIATYLLFLILSMNFLDSFRLLLDLGSSFAYLLEGAGKVREILEEPVQLNGNLQLNGRFEKGIEFRDVDFKYDNNEIFKDFSLKIKPNTTIALVGPSGSGKTTLTQLIGRFWDVNRGQILIDGIDIRNISIDNLMDNMSFVFQDVFMLHDTILENIRMGSNASLEEVINAAKKAQIHEFIMTLPHRYETKLGEHGTKLSGGEKQRISIARAILKDSPIVLLDEVTSYSDIENESKIQEALKNLLKDKTTIIIAHRLYTIKNSDNIIVLNDGKIVEQGTHERLLKNRNLYRHLWDMYELEGNQAIRVEAGVQHV
ncbi:ABC transporter ATP-binding protein [Tissierella sp.]|uniref:ABC transporter ATP-binding protein n=1 Tax=Tissierella sp. TaxID=41274 RepID=UPI0028AA2B9B|nr:ABC transporter ATP-binding protein [Tissierella sp.]